MCVVVLSAVCDRFQGEAWSPLDGTNNLKHEWMHAMIPRLKYLQDGITGATIEKSILVLGWFAVSHQPNYRLLSFLANRIVVPGLFNTLLSRHAYKKLNHESLGDSRRELKIAAVQWLLENKIAAEKGNASGITGNIARAITSITLLKGSQQGLQISSCASGSHGSGCCPEAVGEQPSRRFS